MNFSLSMLPFTLAALAVGSMIILLLKVCKKTPRQKRIVICGLPNAGKTKLYIYINTNEVPETVTSAQITKFFGCFDANPNQRCELVDIPSDERIQSTFDFGTAGRIVFMAPEYSREAVQRLAQLLTKVDKNCEVLTNITEKAFPDEVEAEYARLNGMDEVQLPWQVEQFELDFSDSAKLEAAVERVLADL